MNIATWLTVVSIVMLGAMSPGPSLAVVLRHTLSGGRRHGCTAAIAHGAGVGLYAFACISGLAFLITTSPGLFRAFQWAGAAYLAWLGTRGLLAKAPPQSEQPLTPAHASAARDGFLIVFLNPKIAIFFIALFSQVIGAETGLLARFSYAATAWSIDTAWYLVVAWLFSIPRWLDKLKRHAIWFERLFGIILLALAARLLLETLL
jgi:threonine/homoserine/homoserine lactone efflux protein